MSSASGCMFIGPIVFLICVIRATLLFTGHKSILLHIVVEQFGKIVLRPGLGLMLLDPAWQRARIQEMRAVYGAGRVLVGKAGFTSLARPHKVVEQSSAVRA